MGCLSSFKYSVARFFQTQFVPIMREQNIVDKDRNADTFFSKLS